MKFTGSLFTVLLLPAILILAAFFVFELLQLIGSVLVMD